MTVKVEPSALSISKVKSKQTSRIFRRSNIKTSKEGDDYYQRTRDRFDGSVTGTIKIKGEVTPDITVKIFDMSDDRLVDQTKTSENSEYTFMNLDRNATYYIIVIDPENLWERRIRSNITPA